MTRLRVRGGQPLRGAYAPVADPAVGALYLALAALAEGDSSLTGPGLSAAHPLIGALAAMGVRIRDADEGVDVSGVGLGGLCAPSGALDAGACPDTLRTLVVLLAGQRFGTRVQARGLAAREDLVAPLHMLRERGAHVRGTRSEDGFEQAPVACAPLIEGERLQPAELAIPWGDAATKSALLLSGLFADGPSAVSEELLSVDHTERALLALGLPLETIGSMAALDRSEPPRWSGLRWQVPGDFGRAAYVLAAACALPGSRVRLEGVGTNPTRAGLLQVLRQAGADVAEVPRGDTRGGEPIGVLEVRGGGLRSVAVGGELAFRVAADLGALCALTPALGGRGLRVRDLAPLRRRDPDLLQVIGTTLAAFQVEHTLYQDGLDVPGGAAPTPAQLDLRATPQVGPLALALALRAPGESELELGADALYPELWPALRELGADLEEGG